MLGNYRKEVRGSVISGRFRYGIKNWLQIAADKVEEARKLSLLNQFQVEMEPRQSQPTDYGRFVVHIVKRMTQQSSAIDQAMLRRAIGLASSYLVTDTSTNSERGIQTWCTGFHRLVDIMVVLHSRGELELETVNEASKACSECWSVAGTWRGMEDCRQGVKEVAAKLKKLLDEPYRRTYKGSKVYTPNSS